MRGLKSDFIYVVTLIFLGLAILVKGITMFGKDGLGAYIKKEITKTVLSSCLPGAVMTVHGEQVDSGHEIVMNEIRGNFPVFQYLEKEGPVQIESEDILEEIRLLEGRDEDQKDLDDENIITDEMIEEDQKETEQEETNDAEKRLLEEKLKDFDYLVSRFYSIDKTTTIGSDQLDAVKMASVDLVVPKNPDIAQILIYHTHSQEGYKDTAPGDESKTVVALGERLAKELEAFGYGVMHDRTSFDKENRDYAYSNAEPVIQKLLDDNPSIEGLSSRSFCITGSALEYA